MEVRGLVVTVRKGDAVKIGEDITLQAYRHPKAGPGQIKIVIDAPKHLRIDRIMEEGTKDDRETK